MSWGARIFSSLAAGELLLKRKDTVMGVVELILIGFIATNAALGVSSLFRVSR